MFTSYLAKDVKDLFADKYSHKLLLANVNVREMQLHGDTDLKNGWHTAQHPLFRQRRGIMCPWSRREPSLTAYLKVTASTLRANNLLSFYTESLRHHTYLK
jgi:hypothetical protein